MNQVISTIKRTTNNIFSKSNEIKKLTKEIAEQGITVSEIDKNDIKKQLSIILANDNDPRHISAINLINCVFNELFNISLFVEQKACAALINSNMLINMDTGEGKTFAIATSASITALKNNTVTIATENDYLAQRDHDNNKKLYEFLGLTSSVVLSTSTKEQRIQAYKSDIIYTTIREISYDYLRNNFAKNSSEIINVIRDKLIIDEADSALIDNASQLHVIDHPKRDASNSTNYKLIYDFILTCSISSPKSSAQTEFKYEKSSNTITTTDFGYNKIEHLLTINKLINKNEDLYTQENLYLIELFETAARAAFILKKGTHYSVSHETLCVLDEISGRKLSSVKLNKGLQQFIEVKEGLSVSIENETAFSISTKFLIGLFKNISGLSGSMLSNKAELEANFQRRVIVVPPHYEKKLTLQPERIFFRQNNKKNEAITKIICVHLTGQPILICTNNEDDAIEISQLLYGKGLAHNVLLDATPKEEANIISLAGKYKAITITTSNAARGTDIPIGDWPDSIENHTIKDKGIFLLGYGHQPLAKSDMQLLGRIARKGKKGTAQFYSSFEDNIFSNYTDLKKRINFFNDYESIEIKSAIPKKLFSIGLNNFQKENNNLIINERAMASRLMDIVEPYARELYLSRINIINAKDTKELKHVLSNHFDIHIHNNIDTTCALKAFDELILENNRIVSNLRRSSTYASYGGRTESNTLINEVRNQAQEFTRLFEEKLRAII